MNRLTASRRDLLRAASTAIAYTAGAAIVGTGMAIASEAHGETIAVTPFRVAEARYRIAERRMTSIPADMEKRDPAAYQREIDAFIEATQTVDEAPVADWQEFAAQFDIAFDGGESVPNEELIRKLLADAARLAGRA